MSLEECRLCGNSNPPKIYLHDKIKGFLSFKEFVEYFCRIELDDVNEDQSSNLPTAVCKDCYSILLNFCKFTVMVETQQNKFKNRLPQVQSGVPSKRKKSEEVVQYKASNDDTGSENSSPTHQDTSKRRKKRNENSANDEEIASNKTETTNLADCLQEVHSIFKDEIELREKQYEKITIKETLLLDFGEIPRSWLERYRDFTTWQDFTYQCCHCNKQIKTLNSLLKHFEEFKIPINRRTIKCHCGKKEFKDQLFLISYLNHVTKDHYSHLKFTCMFCSKVFVNVYKMSSHLAQSHGKMNLKYFPCFDCGLVCNNSERLKQHKNCHEI